MIERVYRGEELAVYEYLECGALGHAWDLVDSNHWTASFGEPVTVRCMRCMMERRDKVMRNSRTLLARRYIQPPGFKFAKGERPSRIDFILMSIDRTKRRKVTKVVSITSTVPKKSRGKNDGTRARGNKVRSSGGRAS